MEKHRESNGKAVESIEKAIEKHWKNTGKTIAKHRKSNIKATEKQWHKLNGNVFEKY